MTMYNGIPGGPSPPKVWFDEAPSPYPAEEEVEIRKGVAAKCKRIRRVKATSEAFKDAMVAEAEQEGVVAIRAVQRIFTDKLNQSQWHFPQNQVTPAQTSDPTPPPWGRTF